MKRTFSVIASSFLVAGFSTAAKVYYPVPGLVNESTGLLESFIAGDWYRGSGVVARDPRLIFSCAHLFYESREWATDYQFYRASHSRDYPDEATGVSPRGLHYFTSYSSGVKAHGTDSDQAFAADFTVLYGYDSFGPAAASWPVGGPALRSSSPKLIVGYPSDIDFTGAAGHCYQHSAGWFNYEAFRLYGGYHEFDDVSTGSGNSGGPIFVRDTATGNDLLAGILVAGTRRTAGIVALDLSTDTLAGYALGLQDKTLAFSETSARKLTDGTKSYTTIPIRVSGFSGTTSKLKLSLSIATKRRGDLDVFLKSPNGRTRWISRRAGGSLDDLEIHDLSLSKFFSGYSPNGTWQIKVRDAAAGTRATFLSGSLKVSAL